MEYNPEDNAMVSVSRINFKLIVNAHREWLSNPVEGTGIKAMCYGCIGVFNRKDN